MRRVLTVDLAIAVAAAIVVLIVSPGYAISGLLAIIVLLVCAVSLVRERRRMTRGLRRLRRVDSRRPPRARVRPPGR
jgi:hypothetical protein